MNYYLAVLKKYVQISGRSRRAEFWMFTLISAVISLLLGLIDRGLGTTFGGGENGVLESVYSLAVLLPSIAVGVRRLHDTDRSGWWILIGFVPIIGWIVLLVFFCLKGTQWDNRFGPDPLAATPSLNPL